MNDIRLAQWDQTRQMLTDLLAWLDETRQWCDSVAGSVESLDEEARQAAVAFDANAAEPRPAAVAIASPTLADDAAPAARPPRADWFAVLAELTALRHELKLQTRSARQDRELAAQMVEQLKDAAVQSERSQREDAGRREAALQDAARATGNLLMDLHDALSRAAREARQVSQTCTGTLRTWSDQLAGSGDAPTVTPPATDAAADGPAGSESTSGVPRVVQRLKSVAKRGAAKLHGWLDQFVLRPDAATSPTAPAPRPPAGSAIDPAELRTRMQREATQLANRVEGVGEGYALSLHRLERALAEQGIEPIECLGQPIDPNLTEVVQTVCDPDQPAGCVVAEVRRGYRRNGQVCRFAQVVANRRPE